MDLSFSLERLHRGAVPSQADVLVLLASLATDQATSPTAMAAARIGTGAAEPADARRTLVSLFAGRAGACEGSSLGGSFHPRVAMAAAGKAGSTLMKPGFTFAF